MTQHQHFLGKWILDTTSCEYEQGEPPKSGSYRIIEEGAELVFFMDWVDAEGESHSMSFRGVPDGRKAPFNGGELADALAIECPNEHELNSSAFRQGLELMTAKRYLTDNFQRMEIVQMVLLPDGTTPANRAFYLREQ